MNASICGAVALFSSCFFAMGSEVIVGSVYLPINPGVDSPVAVREVPYATSGAFPEVWFDAITQPYIVQQGAKAKGFDMNLASLAGVKISCESAAAGQTKLYITWDFTKAHPKLVNEALVNGLLKCLEKTAGGSIGLYTKVVGGEKFPEAVEQVLKRIPAQTEEQRKVDSGGGPWSKKEINLSRRLFTLGGKNARQEVVKRYQQAKKVETAQELWMLEQRIGEWRREISNTFRTPYSEELYAKCLQRGWLQEKDLAGFAPDRLKRIEKIRAGIAEPKK